MEACIIKKVKIERLWGVKDIECQLNEDVNIIIGPNGSGKSTFLNLIEGVLQCDVPILMSVQFSAVTLELASSEYAYIRLTQEQTEESLVFTYYFGENIVFKFNSYDTRRMGRTSYRSTVIDDVRRYLEKTVNISWLSVNRFNPFLERDRAENRPYSEIDENLVNTKVRALMHDLVVYRLRLGNHINQLKDKQNQEVFSLLLFNKEYDVFNPDNIQAYSQLDPRSTQTALFRIFKQLGISAEKREDIQEHIKAMSAAVEKVQNGGDALNLNDVFPLSLINRTMSLIEISKRYSKEIDKILEPAKNYLTCLQRFMEDKEFTFSDNSGELHIDIKPIVSKETNKELVGRKSIVYNSLSSGEKQLLILLTQTLLQENKNYVFIADEPELSLHIDWQHKIIGAIRELNPNAQIIVATHSPEIAGKWQDSITNLQNVTTYGE